MEHVKNKPVILCTWDIEAMYINITNQLSIEACRKLLNERAVQEPSTEAIEITLEENIAQFDCIVVKQRDGTAMGPHHACLYADIAVDLDVDQKVNDITLNKHHANIDLNYACFRDNIISMWTGTLELLEYGAWLNLLDPHLRFTLLYS